MSERENEASGGPPVRYAVIGLGHIAQVAVLPAFQHAENSRLVALISDDHEKLSALGELYGVTMRIPLDDYDEFLESGAVDAVYIAVPNHLHCEYTIRAAKAGVHVLCEKPLALTEHECRLMIGATEDAGVKLMTAYRLHFEPASLEVLDIVRRGRLGEVRAFTSTFAMPVKEGDIRLWHATGGGTLYDLGVYCINAARHIFGDEPTEVWARCARGKDPRYAEVDESTSAVLRFAGERLATFLTSFNGASVSEYRIVGTEGTLRVSPSYDYSKAIQYELEANESTECKETGPHDQFASELLHFSDCIRRDVTPEPDGYEGLADVRIVEALYRSSEAVAPISLARFDHGQRPGFGQRATIPPVTPPQQIKAEGPRRRQ